MRISMGSEFGSRSKFLRIDDDNGHWIVLEGESSNHHIPFYGMTLDEGEEERLRKWLNGERE